MPFGLGVTEIVILAVVLMLLFGAKGVPSAARRLGSSVREVKDAVGDMDPRGILDPKDEPKQVARGQAAPAALPAPAPVAAPVQPPAEPEPAPASKSESDSST